MILCLLLLAHVVTIALIVRLAYIWTKRVGGTLGRMLDVLNEDLGGPVTIVPVIAQIICVVFWSYEFLSRTKIPQKWNEILNKPL